MLHVPAPHKAAEAPGPCKHDSTAISGFGVTVIPSMGKKSGAKSTPTDATNFSDASLQVLRVLHEVGDHTPCALLSVGDDRLCFNCPEGFQRCCAEGQVRLLCAPVYRPAPRLATLPFSGRAAHTPASGTTPLSLRAPCADQTVEAEWYLVDAHQFCLLRGLARSSDHMRGRRQEPPPRPHRRRARSAGPLYECAGGVQ